MGGVIPEVGQSGREVWRDNAGRRQLNFGGLLGGIDSVMAFFRLSSVMVRVTMTKRIFFHVFIAQGGTATEMDTTRFASLLRNRALVGALLP